MWLSDLSTCFFMWCDNVSVVWPRLIVKRVLHMSTVNVVEYRSVSRSMSSANLKTSILSITTVLSWTWSMSSTTRRNQICHTTTEGWCRVWQIWFRRVVDDIDQVQDNTVVMLRMLVFRFADDIDRDTERYSTTLTVLMWSTRLTIRRGHTTDTLSHHMKKHVERSDNHMTLNMTLGE
jgi:hypothetical protein